jgi:hypothetical protein
MPCWPFQSRKKNAFTNDSHPTGTLEPFLEKYGFHLVESESCESGIRFRSDKVDWSVGYDWLRTYEVVIWFARTDGTYTHSCYELDMIYRELGIIDDGKRFGLQTTDYAQVLEFLTEVCQTLMQYGSSVLSGDPAMYAKLKERLKDESHVYTIQIHLSSARKRAETAWRENRFADYLEALRGFENSLTGAERAKLEYARKQYEYNRGGP